MSVDVIRTGRVAQITINRPEALNALSSEILEELHAELDALKRDAGIGAIVLTGAGEKAFIAGADIRELSTKTALEAREYAELGQECSHMLETMRKATIAAVNGYALGGGCEMALACDIRLAADNATFGQPEINLGIMPGWGGTQRLARTTSLGFAKELILSGRMVPAQEALERGLVNSIHPQADLLPKALELAEVIASKSPVAVAYCKDSTNRALHGDIGSNLVHEADLFSILFSTEDAKEGLGAFVDKRKPEFIGR